MMPAKITPGMDPGMQAPPEAVDFNARRAWKSTRGAYIRDRQQAMDEKAAEQVEDGPGFWSEAWKAVSWGAASAFDETLETVEGAIAEAIPTEAEVGEGAQADYTRQAMAARGLRPKEEGPRPEVKYLRDGYGLAAPSTAEGQMAASMVQFGVGMAMAAPLGPAVGGAKLAAAGAKAAGKVAPKLAGKETAQTAAEWAVGGQVAAGASAFAAFDGADQRMLVAMNEVPALGRFIPDMLASHDPTAPEWENRFYRMVEEGVLGGLAGAAAGAVWGSIKAYARGVRGGRPGAVLDSPDKGALRDAQDRQAVSDMNMIEQEMMAADVDDVIDPLDPFDFEAAPMREGMEAPDAAPRMPMVFEKAGEDFYEPVDIPAGGLEKDKTYFVEDDEGNLVEVGEDLREFIATGGEKGHIVATEEQALALEEQAGAQRETQAMKLGPGGAPLKDVNDLVYRELLPLNRAERRERQFADGERTPHVSDTTTFLASIHGAATDTGLREVATPALAQAERVAGDRLREAQVDPANQVRAARAEQAAQAYRRVFSEEWRTAKAARWVPNPPDETGMWADAAAGQQWQNKHVTAMRDVGRLNPDLDEAAAPPGPASVRAQTVTEARTELPEDWGSYDADAMLERQRPEVQDSIPLPEVTRSVLRSDAVANAELPVDVHFDAIHTQDDIASVVQIVSEARVEDVGIDHTAAIDALRRTVDEEGQAIRAAQAAIDEMPTTNRQEKRARGEAIGAIKEQTKLHREHRGQLDGLRREQEVVKQREGDAYKAAQDILVDNGYAGRLRQDVDPRIALHTIEAVTGSIQRIAQGAASDGVSSAQRAAALRALHKADAAFQWLQGDERAAAEALRRGELPMEEEGLVFGKTPEETQVLESAVQRRLRDKTLVSQSGGTQRVQAHMAGLALAKDSSQVLQHLNAWRQDARYAWSLDEAMGLHNLPKTVMQIRMGGMLSRPGTWAMNLTSNALMAAVRVPERFLSEAMNVSEHGIGGAMAAAARESADMVEGVAAGARDGLQLLKADAEIMWRGEQAGAAVREKLEGQNLKRVYEDAQRLDQFEQFNKASAVGVPTMLREAAADTKMQGAAELADKLLQVGATHGMQTQQLGDMWFKGVNRGMELNRLVKKHVHQQLGPRTPDNRPAWDAAVDRYLRDPPDDIHRRTMEFAHIGTFTNESVGLVEDYVRLLKRYPALRLVTPFVRTPANVMLEAVKRTPLLATALKTERAAWRAGGEAKRDMVARQAIGGMVGVGVYALAMNGRVSGSPPANKQLARAWRASGKKENAVKVGDAWVDYRQLLGFYGIPIVAAADAAEMMLAAETAEEVEVAREVGTAAVQLGSFFMDSTFLGGWADLNDLASQRSAGRFVRRQLESFVPLSAQARSLERQFRDRGIVADPTVSGRAGGADERLSEYFYEEWATFRKTIVDRHFGFLGSNADRYARLDHRGREVNYQDGGTALGVMDMVLGYAGPAAYSYEKQDALSRAEIENEFHPGWASRRLTVAYPKGSDNTRTIEMDARHYDWIARRQGTLYEQNAKMALESVQWRDGTRFERKAMLEGAAGAARRQARQELIASFPDMRRRLEDTEALLELRYAMEQRGG